MKKAMTGLLGGVVLGGLLLFVWVTLQGTKSPLYGRWTQMNQTKGEAAIEFYPDGRYLTVGTDGRQEVWTYRIVNDHQISYPGFLGSERICNYALVDPYMKPLNPHPSNVRDLEIRCSEDEVQTYLRDDKGPQFSDKPTTRLF